MSEYTIKEYLASKQTIRGKYDAICKLIDAMILSVADSIEVSGTMTYSMDDGQMKVMTQYRSIDQIVNGIKSLEQIKNIYGGQLGESTTVLRGRINSRCRY